MENQQQLTHWKKLTNPNYIGSEILQPGQELKLTIEKIAKEQVKTAEGTQECIVAYFIGGKKGMILNKTNCKIITKVLDTPYIDNWVGKSIVIYAAKVKAFGDMVEALRVKNQKV
jgi:hypothetical protein